MTDEDAEWLAGRIGRDGRLRDDERALLRVLRHAFPDVHPSLKPLVAMAA